jgi:hypothetical protein
LEAIYYVMCFACHRRCEHCYEDRFRPYVRDELVTVVAEAKANYARIIDHFPDRITYLDLADPAEDGTLPEKTGRVILSGGEALLDPLRAEVTYKVVERLTVKYGRRGGVKIVVQTTGDLLVLSQRERAWRQLFELIDMRAESVENGRPRREKRVGAARRRGSNRSREPELAAAGIAADGPQVLRSQAVGPAACPSG